MESHIRSRTIRVEQKSQVWTRGDEGWRERGVAVHSKNWGHLFKAIPHLQKVIRAVGMDFQLECGKDELNPFGQGNGNGPEAVPIVRIIPRIPGERQGERGEDSRNPNPM